MSAVSVEMKYIVCSACGLLYGVPRYFYAHRCPGPHCCRLRREDVAEAGVKVDRLCAQRAALRGALTKLKRREMP